MQEEIWKDVPGYENLYQVSSLGRVKSLQRYVNNNGGKHLLKERLLKFGLSKGYYNVVLYKDKKNKNIKVHKLVAMAFLNHKPNGYELVIDHINDNKLDNTVENLQVVTQRENTHKYKRNSTSKYVGVFYYKTRDKWVSKIYSNRKSKTIGYFNNEFEAHLAYQKELKLINNK